MEYQKEYRRYIIEMQCIDEANEWGLKYGQKVYYDEVSVFALSPFDGLISRSKSTLTEIVEKILDEGNFMPTIKNVICTIE